jgi:hypothetical protein
MENTTQTLEEAKQILAEVVAEEEKNEQETAQEEVKEEVNEQDNAQPEDPAEQEFDADKAAEQFDVTRASRKAAMAEVETILTRAASGHNVDKKKTLKCLRALYMTTYMQDMLLVSLMGDLIRAVRGMAKTEVDVFNITAKTFTITQALYKKGLVTQDYLEQIHQELTVPQMMQNLQTGKEEEEGEEEKVG